MQLDNGQLQCWGDNYNGALGTAPKTWPVGAAPGEMGAALPFVNLGTGRSASSIDLGFDRTCSTLDDGQLKCWGENRGGALGIGDANARGFTLDEMGDELPAVYLGNGRTARSVSTGFEHTCAILETAASNVGGPLRALSASGMYSPYGSKPGEMAMLPSVDLGQGEPPLPLLLAAITPARYSTTAR